MTRKEYIEDTVLQTQEAILLKLFSPGKAIVIFDIGACEGESSVRYHRLFPKAVIHAFEPLSDNFNWIRKNIESYAAYSVIPHQLCLSDKTGELEFYVSAGKPDQVTDEDWDYGNKSSSLLPPGEQQVAWLKFDNKVTVPATTLQLFCDQHSVNAIDFIHMDVQGAELMVLNGAGDFIKNIHTIWLEVEAVELYRGQPLKSDVERYLQSRGFIKITDTVYDTAGDQFWVNGTFVDQNGLGPVIKSIRRSSALTAFRKRWIRKIQKLWKR